MVLGVGGMGCVYRAWDDKLDRMVAVKVLRSELIADASQPSKYLDRFRREAKVIAGFDHPGIVQVYDMGEGRLSGQTVYYLVMQLVSGMTLSAAHQKYGPLATLQLIEIMAKVLAALQHAHDRGVVHRDIKPSNIMLTDTGGVKVMDFGIAHLAGGNELLTGTGDVVGTFAYLAPEQAQDSRRVDARTDIYAVGCTIYHLLTNRLPFPGETPWQIIEGRMKNQFPPVSEVRPALGTVFDEIIERSLAFDPADRYPSATAMREELLRLRAHLPAGHDTAESGFTWSGSDEQTALRTPWSDQTTGPGGPSSEDTGASTVASPSTPAKSKESESIPAPSPEPAAQPAQPVVKRQPSRRLVLAGIGGAAVAVVGGAAVWRLGSSSEETKSVPRPTAAGEVWWTNQVSPMMLSSTPLVVDDRVFIGGADAKVYALELNSGTPTWTTTIGDRVRPSPVVAADTVVATSWDGRVYGLSVDAGTVRWKTPTGNQGDSYPVSPATAENLVFLATTDWFVLALDPATGQVRWQTPVNGTASSAPAIANGTVYVGTDGHVSALDAATGTIKWSVSAGDSWTAPAIGDSMVYLGSDDGSMYAFDASSGAQAWKAPMGGEVYSSPVVANGFVYVGGYDNNIYALDAKTGEVRWKTATGGHVTASPTVSKNVVYAGSWDGYLYALDDGTGKVSWKAPTGGPIWSSPAVAQDAVFVGSYEGKVFAFQT